MQSKYYKEFNPNPLGKEVGDCQIRALCAVTNKSWYEIYDLLVDYGRITASPFFFTDKDACYYTDLFGMKMHKLPKREKGKKAMTVSQFCKEHPSGKYILRCAKHVIGIVNGEYYDLYPAWDNSTVYKFFEYIESEN